MLTRRFLLAGCVCTLTMIVLAASGPDDVVAQETKDGIGAWDGAVWRFSLTPARGNRRAGPLRGRYRVENLELFQSESMEGKEMNKKVGTSQPGPGKRPEFTVVKFEDVRAFSRNRELVVFKTLQGRVVKGAERGEVEGKLISDDGFYWDFKAARVQE